MKARRALQRDDGGKRGVLKGAGQDSLSNSKAAGDIAYRLTARSARETEVAVDLQYSLQGPLAQFSRSGLVRDFVRRMIADFGKSVARRMDPTLSESERMKTVQLNPAALFFGVLWERLKRLLGERRTLIATGASPLHAGVGLRTCWSICRRISSASGCKPPVDADPTRL
ncbi:hypothetical protein ACTMU2_10415 [Cupriavidus basilensis]